jgi:hypothetical protein
VKWTLEPDDPSVILNGANTVDIPGEALRDYKLTVYGLKPVQNKATIYFRNLQTHEF